MTTSSLHSSRPSLNLGVSVKRRIQRFSFISTPGSSKQHTFVETDSVRYVYQPLGSMYMLVITTKNSNIFVDLETLRLFSRVIPEYCRTIDERSVQAHSFDLIFAFDEVVALGYGEGVNLAQICAFTEMKSREEKLFLALKKIQENQTMATMRKKVKELQQTQRNVMGSGTLGRISSLNVTTVAPNIPALASGPNTALSTPSSRKGMMKLNTKKKDVDNFLDKVIAEDESVQ